ncbi:MAG: double-cubane-cluster-containing anaerobic reductase [Bacillota bacterium]
MTETDYRAMWQELGMDLDKHDEFLEPLPGLYEELFINQENRPEAMEYFNFVMSEVHHLRVKELVEEKEAGNPVVSSFCVFVPDELVLAAGGSSIGLCAGAEYPVSSGEEVLPRDICPLIKASVGFKLDRICPYFEVSDFVVGETTCDGKKKAWEVLDDLIPTYVMELPQRKSEASQQLWRSEVERFKERVEEEAGRKIDSQDLADAIALNNQKRAVLQRLYETRQADPVPISGKDALLITQLAFFDDIERFVEKVSTLCDELEERIAAKEGVAKPGTPRILIAGTPMPLPYWKIHNLIETSGGVVVCEETCTGTRYFEEKVAEDGANLSEQLDNLSQRAMGINCACFTPNNDRVDDVLRLAKDYDVDGVVYANLEFCQTYDMEYQKVAQALKEEGIPVTQIESDFSDSDVGQLKTRIQAFIEMLD